jgi:integral membrane protein (TIGR00529 family)
MGIWRNAGRATLLVKSLEKTINNPYAVLVLPSALIGLIPIIGGAMISAPLLEDSSYSKRLTPARKTFINYWFRHLWEYISPTYGGIILTATLLKISYAKIFLLNLPLTITSIIGGILFGLVGLKYDKENKKKVIEPRIVQDLFFSILPLVLIIIFAIVFKIELFISISIVIIGMIIIYKISLNQSIKIFKETFTITIISLVWGVMCFKNIIEKTGIITQLSQDFIEWRIPVILLIFILPFIIGLLTGLTVAYVGITFPLFLQYLTANNYYLPLAYFGGYFGLLLTPMHYCLSLTREYFNADWKDVYKILIWPCLLNLVVTLIYTYIMLHFR